MKKYCMNCMREVTTGTLCADCVNLQIADSAPHHLKPGTVLRERYLIGNVIGEAVCKLFRIYEPIAKGLALGTSSHAIGTAKALEMGEVEGAMSSLAIAVAGLLTVIGASVFAGFY